METIRGHQDVATPPLPAAVGIGIFDGVHKGHQALLAEVLRAARKRSLRAVAYTFFPHPKRALTQVTEPRLIEPLASRLQRLEALGIDAAVVEPFNADFASLSPEAFAHDVLAARLGARHVVVGTNFHFGIRQTGDVDLLRALGAKHSFSVEAVKSIEADGLPISSTRVRRALKTGDLHLASTLLGRFYDVEARVVRGQTPSHSLLGFPTAQLESQTEIRLPPGVYVARATGVFGHADALVAIHLPPSKMDVPAMEAHLFHYHGPNFYDSSLCLSFVAYLRQTDFSQESRFAWRTQVGEDAARARAILQKQE